LEKKCKIFRRQILEFDIDEEDEEKLEGGYDFSKSYNKNISKVNDINRQ